MKKSQVVLTTSRITYLQMIQETISRMSTTSSIFKGFSSTIVAGIALLSFHQIDPIVLILSFCPLIAFASLDVYYLRLERKQRYLYELVRLGIKEVDFSMRVKLSKGAQKNARARVVDCLCSPSFYLFYPLMFLIVGVVIYMYFQGMLFPDFTME
jgi:hypothetical protein